MNNFEYSGTELGLFEHAKNWKTYWSNKVRPYIGESILEVGAGIGATAKILNISNNKSWVCLEPDIKLCTEINNKINANALPQSLDVRAITIEQLNSKENFDTILYIDVLEHIENDKAELKKAASHLVDGGNIIIVSPSHNFLYSEFDAAIGHHRRYSKKMLQSIVPDGMSVRKVQYIDCVGLFASLANKLILKSAKPTLTQIHFWDRFMVPASRLLDPLLAYRFGKSIIFIIKKDENYTNQRSI